MMRALGFDKEHVLVFIVLQAFSFAVPGMLLGLILALLLNDGFRESIYYSTHYAGEYGLTGESMLVSVILMGFVVPLISNIGPTREALQKNLRSSLDASRRDGGDESVSVAVTNLKDIAMSRRELITGLYLVGFGVTTYYFLPFSILTSDYGLFFTVLNLVMISLLIGIVFILAVILPAC